MNSGKSPVETDINEIRPKFHDTLKIYEIVQTAADALLYDDAARLEITAAAPQLSNAPEIVLVVNVVGPNWASVGVVTFWSILRKRTTSFDTEDLAFIS